MTAEELLPDEARRRELEREVRAFAASGRGVILGRGAVVLLRDDPRALHVLLDGPVEARSRQAMAIEGIDRATAERRLARVDRFRRAYVEDLYGVDVREPGVFHLVLDSTAIALDDCVEIIADAARRRRARAATESPPARRSLRAGTVRQARKRRGRASDEPEVKQCLASPSRPRPSLRCSWASPGRRRCPASTSRRIRPPLAIRSPSPPTTRAGEPVTCVWDFGDGSGGASGRSVSHQYDSAGAVTVSLTTDDPNDADLPATESKLLVIVPPILKNRAPEAAASAAPTRVLTNEVVQFDSSDSSDPDGDALTREWDLDGDGLRDRRRRPAVPQLRRDRRYRSPPRHQPSGECDAATVRIPPTTRPPPR